jgi:hypothetical protein
VAFEGSVQASNDRLRRSFSARLPPFSANRRSCLQAKAAAPYGEARRRALIKFERASGGRGARCSVNT